jgi:transposase
VRAQEVLREDPFSGHLFVFRGRRGDLIKVLYWDGQGLCLFASGWSAAGSSGRRRARARWR